MSKYKNYGKNLCALAIEGGVDLKTVLSQNGLIKELTKGIW
ncbi:hypothetical protein [Rickettsia endosymbiont of Urophora cardui]